MKPFFKYISQWLRDRFSLEEDKADEQEIVESIRRDISFRGAHLWTLIFAIFVASIGLNVNSTAVIIGAMLISPLMGPIMGVGLAIGTNDLAMLKKGIKNVTIAVFFSVLTSSLYFYLTPLQAASSELLARTNPSLWDVFIAFFGGLAGIAAGTRKSRGNAIPGVAIATALMPPLCTAGFGLAMGHWTYFFGALYLFFINSVFICFATFLIVRHLRFHRKEFPTPSGERKVMRSIWLIVTVAFLPSIYLTYQIVQRSIFEENAKNFVQKEFHFNRSQVVNRSFRMDGKAKVIDLLIIGQELAEQTIDSLRKRLPLYSLDSTRLVVRQGLNRDKEIDIAQIKASIIEDVFKQDPADTGRDRTPAAETPGPDLGRELKLLFPGLTSYSLSQAVIVQLDSTRKDSISLITTSFKKPLSRTERQRMTAWLKQRIGADSIKLVID